MTDSTEEETVSTANEGSVTQSFDYNELVDASIDGDEGLVEFASFEFESEIESLGV